MSNSVMNNQASVNSSNSVTPESNALKNPLPEQVNKLRQILFTKDTATTFGQSFRLLGVLIKEMAVLAWLALCWGIVAIGWLVNKTGQTGQFLQASWTTLQTSNQHHTPSEIATETGKTVLNKGKTAIAQIMTEAKKQVGLVDEPTEG